MLPTVTERRFAARCRMRQAIDAVVALGMLLEGLEEAANELSEDSRSSCASFIGGEFGKSWVAQHSRISVVNLFAECALHAADRRANTR